MAKGEELLRFFSWRMDNRDRQQVAEDSEQFEAFADRARDLRDEVNFVLASGLNEGAEASLSAMAEQDMGDFCTLVDLSERIPLPGVEPLEKDTAEHLREFLDHEPWRSLRVDNDITVAVAMLEDVAVRADEGPWYRICPNMARVVADVLSQANAEQVQRFVGEIEAACLHKGLRIPQDVASLVGGLLHTAARELGMKPPRWPV